MLHFTDTRYNIILHKNAKQMMPCFFSTNLFFQLLIYCFGITAFRTGSFSQKSVVLAITFWNQVPFLSHTSALWSTWWVHQNNSTTWIVVMYSSVFATVLLKKKKKENLKQVVVISLFSTSQSTTAFIYGHFSYPGYVSKLRVRPYCLQI